MNVFEIFIDERTPFGSFKRTKKAVLVEEVRTLKQDILVNIQADCRDLTLKQIDEISCVLDKIFEETVMKNDA